MKKCLIIVDMLNDFVNADGALYVTGAETLVDGIATKANEFIANGDIVVYANDGHTIDDPEFKTFPKHCVIGENGAEIVDGLKFALDQGANRFYKTTFSGFSNEGLNGYLKALVDEIYICGVATDFCIKETAIDGANRDFKVFVYADLIKGLGGAEAALKEMAMRGVNLI